MDEQQTSTQKVAPEIPLLEAGYPVSYDAMYPESSSRLWALATLLFFIGKMIVLIPHAIILYVLSFVSIIVAILAQVVVLITGKYPRPLFDFVVGFTRWQVRVNAFALGITDKYPPFTFK